MSFLNRGSNRRGRCLPCFFALALVGAGTLIPAPAQAQTVECSAIMGDVKAGKLYAVTVLKGKDKGQVKIETLKGNCFEPLEKWKARGLPMVSLGNGSFIAPPKKKIYTPPPIPTKRLTAPPPTSAYSSGKNVLQPPGKYMPDAPPPTGDESGIPPGGQAKSQEDLTGKTGAYGEEAITKPPVREGRCDLAIKYFWGPGEIDIKGSSYWLSGAFTVDLDGDGWVDNVGFKLKIPGRVGNVIRYFDAPGRLSGQTIPDLKIPNDDDISRLCPGNVTFALPALPKTEAQVEEKAAKNETEVSKEPAVKEPEKKKKGLSGISLVILSGAGVVLFISGIVILFLLQPEFAARRKKKKKEDEEDGEDDEDEDEDEDE